MFFDWMCGLLQDFSIDPTKEISIQIPAQNLVSMAMHGSRNVIGVWDVDEYLVLPSHKPIMHEVCLLALCMALLASWSVEAAS